MTPIAELNNGLDCNLSCNKHLNTFYRPEDFEGGKMIIQIMFNCPYNTDQSFPCLKFTVEFILLSKELGPKSNKTATYLNTDLAVPVLSIPGKCDGLSKGPAQPTCKVRIHLRTKEQPKKTSISVSTLFLRLAEKQLLLLIGLFPLTSAWNSLAIEFLMTLIPIREEQNKWSLERLH